MSVITTHSEVVELDESGASDLFDQITRKHLNMSGSDFLEQWTAGRYAEVDIDSVRGLAQVVTALPFAGK